MEKQLILPTLSAAMEKAGLSGASLARELGVSRKTVSKWLKGRSFPRPDKLLELALLTGLRLNDLVVRGSPESEPVIAFRKRGASKTTEKHIARAGGGKFLTARVLDSPKRLQSTELHSGPTYPLPVKNLPPPLRVCVGYSDRHG